MRSGRGSRLPLPPSDSSGANAARVSDGSRLAEGVRHAYSLGGIRRDGRSVRSGGHSLLSHSTNTGGVVIGLPRLDDVQVLDAGRRLVRVEAVRP